MKTKAFASSIALCISLILAVTIPGTAHAWSWTGALKGAGIGFLFGGIVLGGTVYGISQSKNDQNLGFGESFLYGALIVNAPPI